jgi:glycosyltransferase involved in cell wall biosynthesis
MPKPRLLHVVAGFDAGGTEMMCLRLAQQWRSRFDQSIVGLAKGTGVLESAFREVVGSQLFHIEPSEQRHKVTIMRSLRDLIVTERFEAVLLHIFGVHHIAAAIVARLGGATKVAAAAGNPPPKDPASRWRWTVVLAASRLIGCPVAACSNTVHANLGSLGVGMPRGSFPIPYGIEATRIASRAKVSRARRREGPFVIGMIARLDRIKDHATLIRAVALVRQSIPEVELWLIGDGALSQQLHSLSEELDLSPHVRFLGTRLDTAELLGQMDVFALSTTAEEGFGICLIEAMAAGLSIVASDAPACREVLDGGRAGLLVKLGDPEDLAAALTRLARQESLRASLIEAARNRVRFTYSIERCAAKWEAMLFGGASPLNSSGESLASAS